ncbi:MAG: hypothetical protein OK456_07960 [Thaumarchaeota archaeon]|nr:hypothetical protein [Nitrososphaerota archaeon]
MVIVALLIVGGAVSFFALNPPLKQTGTTSTTNTVDTTIAQTTCPSLSPVKDVQINSTTYDAVTEFALPSNQSGPNAITVAPDGSVWFTENGLPGIGHLYANGTLNEYALPFTYSPDSGLCDTLTYDWGVALWNGSAWAVDEDSGQIIGVNPSTGAITNITLSSEVSPYTLAVGPDNRLYFTQFNEGPKIGRVSPGNDSIQYLKLPGNSSWSSAYVLFQNSTTGYVLSINTFLRYPNAANSLIYSFNPELQNPVFQQVGGNVSLNEPSSIAVGEGGIWLTEHSGSGLAFFNTTSSKWTMFPTSLVPYVPVTLTYFDVANASAVWFNEHYGNKIGVIYDNGGRLTEYGVDNPPITNFTSVLEGVNTLTVGLGDGRLWFTQWTAGVVGFVNTSYSPPFSISPTGSAGASPTVSLAPGGSANLQLQVVGHSSDNLSVQFSDNEQGDGTPQNITFTPSLTSITQLNGSQPLSISISAASVTPPGNYFAAVTVNNGLVLVSIYVTIDVTG